MKTLLTVLLVTTCSFISISQTFNLYSANGQHIGYFIKLENYNNYDYELTELNGVNAGYAKFFVNSSQNEGIQQGTYSGSKIGSYPIYAAPALNFYNNQQKETHLYLYSKELEKYGEFFLNNNNQLVGKDWNDNLLFYTDKVK